MRFAVHDGMAIFHQKTHGTQSFRKLFPWIECGHLFRLFPRHPSGQLFHIRFRPGVPTAGNGIPQCSGFFGFAAFSVIIGNGQINAIGIPYSGIWPVLCLRAGFRQWLGAGKSGLPRFGQPRRKSVHAASGRDIPLLALTIPARAELLCLPFLPVGNIQIHTFCHGLFLAFRHGGFRFWNLSLTLLILSL